MSDLAQALERAFGAERVRRDVALAPFTTFKVGGRADLFIETRDGEEVVRAVKLAHEAGVKTTVLGGGSNVLVADAGIRGRYARPTAGAPGSSPAGAGSSSCWG